MRLCLIQSRFFQPFLLEHQLPNSFIDFAQQWYLPLADCIIDQQNQNKRPLLLGINGCQGSGKTTLAAFLAYFFQSQGLQVAVLSIDDFYFPQSTRQLLADTIHPLLKTRGVPGTHDVALLKHTLDLLLSGQSTIIPRFSKLNDNPLPTNKWDRIEKPADVVIFEGWFLGASAQTPAELVNPINRLEKEQDPKAIWRLYANRQLANSFSAIFGRVDYWVMLKAPGFHAVHQWRLEQEQKLSIKTNALPHVMSSEQIADFIAYFQRITEHCLRTLPNKMNDCFYLNEQRDIIKVIHKAKKL